RVLNLGTTNVQLVYSEAVEAASATNLTNYVFTNGLAITRVALNADNLTVTLTTSQLVYGSNYALVINGVRDRAATPNTITNNTRVTFIASPYATQDIGNPSVASVTTSLDIAGLNIMAVGSRIGGLWGLSACRY